MPRLLSLASALSMIGLASPALAQDGLAIEAGFVSDYRLRGLSWSDGEAAAQAYVAVPVAANVDLGVQATTLRGAARHGDAEVGIDLSAAYVGRSGLLSWHAMGIARIFPGGEGPLDYFEAQSGANLAFGPGEVGALVSYAPAQEAIGGDNLYLQVNALASVPNTPFTLTAHIGRSSGSVDDPLRAQRLRPGGTYTDWSLGAEYHLAPLVLSLSYSDTDIDEDVLAPSPYGAHIGARLVAGASVRF